MALTFQAKILNIAQAEAAYLASLKDLCNPTTGEYLMDGECVIDNDGDTSYVNDAGRVRRHKIKGRLPVPPPPAPPAA
jgi:hypothetical protein